MRESNSQPTVLETGALPIELISYQVLKHRTFDCGRLCNSKSTVQTALHRCSSAIFTTKCAKVTSVLAPPNFGLLFYYTICVILSQVFCINFSQNSRPHPQRDFTTMPTGVMRYISCTSKLMFAFSAKTTPDKKSCTRCCSFFGTLPRFAMTGSPRLI